jgi:hypothetical protein
MRVDAFALRLRTRTGQEGGDLGARLCQAAAGSVFPCYWAVAAPLFTLILVACESVSPGWSFLLIWLSKPWLDRTILFVLSRAAFGTRTSLRELWAAKRSVWGGQLLATLIGQRLSLRRAFTQPVYQLEGLRGGARRTRLRVLGKRTVATARGLTSAYSMAETALVLALLAVTYWLAPQEEGQSLLAVFRVTGAGHSFLMLACYVLAVLFLEPFYVAAGFGLYLSRRVDLEAWDIEQEFRAVFAR